ncbi:OsmC family protein [Kitasatospora purpeofusca]|uniref:OsmC family protein n=1 Tax=Kitasatospora purpeofusca TaxID=67352 RepID=UPI0033E02901
MDQPVDDGGQDGGPTPTELFAASLASCVAFYAGRYLTRHGVDPDGLRVDADFTMAADRPARVAEMTLTVVPPEDLAPARYPALLAVASHCTVHNTLHRPPAVRIGTAPPDAQTAALGRPTRTARGGGEDAPPGRDGRPGRDALARRGQRAAHDRSRRRAVSRPSRPEGRRAPGLPGPARALNHRSRPCVRSTVQVKGSSPCRVVVRRSACRHSDGVQYGCGASGRVHSGPLRDSALMPVRGGGKRCCAGPTGASSRKDS